MSFCTLIFIVLRCSAWLSYLTHKKICSFRVLLHLLTEDSVRKHQNTKRLLFWAALYIRLRAEQSYREVGRSTRMGKGEDKTSSSLFFIIFHGLKTALSLILIANLIGLRNAKETPPYLWACLCHGITPSWQSWPKELCLSINGFKICINHWKIIEM